MQTVPLINPAALTQDTETESDSLKSSVPLSMEQTVVWSLLFAVSLHGEKIHPASFL